MTVWSPSPPKKSFEPWACARCPAGKMVWFASDLHANENLIEHKFACDKCGEIEHLTVPFDPQPDAA